MQRWQCPIHIDTLEIFCLINNLRYGPRINSDNSFKFSWGINPHVTSREPIIETINFHYKHSDSPEYPMDTLFKPFFLGYSREKSKTGVFLNWESLSRYCILILNGSQNFIFISYIYTTLIDWILYTFQDTRTRSGLVLILRKREDQALISISNILKFSALIWLWRVSF